VREFIGHGGVEQSAEVYRRAVTEWVRSHHTAHEYAMSLCWGGLQGSAKYGCTDKPDTDIGLCDDHYEEIVGGGGNEPSTDRPQPRGCDVR
jgi:hypothetical protein